MGIEKMPISFRADEEVIEELKKLAKERNRTLSNFIETILKKYLTSDWEID